MRAIVSSILLTAVLATGLEHTRTTSPDTTPTRTETAAVSLAASSVPPRVRQERRVIEIVNNKRAKHGCRALKERRTLRKAARRHSRRMANQNVLSHQLFREPSLGVRVTNAGYTNWRLVGENLAMSNRHGYAWTPRQVVRAWMRSPGHRANILNCNYRHIGVGLKKADGVRWWTQDFGRKW